MSNENNNTQQTPKPQDNKQISPQIDKKTMDTIKTDKQGQVARGETIKK